MTPLDIKPVSFPTYEANVPVSGPVPHAWQDWSSPMKEKLQAAIEDLPCAPHQRREIVSTACQKDPDGWFVRVIVMILPRLQA